MNEIIVVAAAFVQETSQGKRLALFRRGPGQSGAGMWEFPGGKLEPCETHQEALAREIFEELGLEVQVQSLVGDHRELVGGRMLHLFVYHVLAKHLNWTLTDHDEGVWVLASEWGGLNVAPHDIPLVEKIFSCGTMDS